MSAVAIVNPISTAVTTVEPKPAPMLISRTDQECNKASFLEYFVKNGKPTHSNDYSRYQMKRNSKGESVIYHTSFLIPRETDPDTADEYDRSFLYWKSRCVSPFSTLAC
jgi:hypothetical protein